MLFDVRKLMASNFVDITKGLAGNIAITLPWPISVNQVWRVTGRRVHLNPDVKRYRQRALSKVAWMKHRKSIPSKPIECDCAVMIEYMPPDKRRRDIDNLAKVVFDAITYAKIWKDDSQAVVVLSYFGDSVKYGAVNVTIQPLEV